MSENNQVINASGISADKALSEEVANEKGHRGIDAAAADAEQSLTAAIDGTLGEVDKELANLESMLAETVAEVEGEPSCGAPAPPLESEQTASPTRAARQQNAAIQDGAATALPESNGATPTPGDSAGGPDAHVSGTTPPGRAHASGPKADHRKATAEAVSETPAPSHDLDPPDAFEVRESLSPEAVPSHASEVIARVVHGVLSAAVSVLVLLDKPFARLRPGTKTALGYAGVGTLLVAIATWVVGSLMDAS